jgi:hypothetical protein
VNHLSLSDLCSGLAEAGFHIQTSMRIDTNQVLIKAVPQQSRAHLARRALVLSCNNLGNFGDRLGFHLINSIMPAQVEVHYGHFKPWQPPDIKFDLLILGTGNSIFEPILTDELISLVRSVPRSIGMFGTQYRELTNPTRLSALLDSLTVWFARYEEDLLLYGKRRKNSIHLGDWLVTAFTMSHWVQDATLNIGKEIWNDLPLDRTIQRIQMYRSVMSERIHPLLCAITSAERVWFKEQREAGTSHISGKFRSMFMDVFGRTWPEGSFFEVNREAVANYRAKVMRIVAGMPQMMNELLT